MSFLKYFFGASKTSTSEYEFKLMHSFDERKRDSIRVIRKYHDKVPIIIEKSNRSDKDNISKNKFIFNKDSKMCNIIAKVRKMLHLDSSTSLYIFVNNIHVPKTTDMIGDVYRKHHDQDMFLYITYS